MKRPPNPSAPTLSEAHDALNIARAEYDDAVASAASARNVETDKRNALNREQKKFDEATAAIKEKNALPDTDWATAKREHGVRAF